MDISICLCLLKAQLSSECASIMQNRKEYQIFHLALKFIHPEPLFHKKTNLFNKTEQLKPSDLESPNLITLFSGYGLIQI